VCCRAYFPRAGSRRRRYSRPYRAESALLLAADCANSDVSDRSLSSSASFFSNTSSKAAARTSVGREAIASSGR